VVSVAALRGRRRNNLSLRPSAEHPASLIPPQWITPAEAAFLVAVDEAQIRSWIEAGLLEAVSMFRNERDPNLMWSTPAPT
jgi:hypothetical protein